MSQTATVFSHDPAAGPVSYPSPSVRFARALDSLFDKVLNESDFDFIADMRAHGCDVLDMIEVLETAALRLGEEWDADRLGFVRVTLAVSRLQRILTSLSQENHSVETQIDGRSILFILPRGESHHFAVSLIEERFRVIGWTTRLIVADRASELAKVLKQNDFAVVCIAWLDCNLLAQVESVLHILRTVSDRDRTLLLAGGKAAEENAAWLCERGIEMVCCDAQLTLRRAERHYARRSRTAETLQIAGSNPEPTQIV